MLVLTLMIGLRVWMAIVVRSRIASVMPLVAHAPTAAVAALVCIAILSPLLSATASSFGQRGWISPSVMWRNSAPGVDLLAYFVPNPLNPLFGAASFEWISKLPGGFNENVASLPWVAMLTIAGAVIFAGYRPIKSWLIFTGVFALLALGPFITIAQHLTYIPTPWAVLRYLPIIGAARTPTRITIVVMMGLAMLLAMAVEHLRQHARRPHLLTLAIGTLLFVELLPAPRILHSAEIPAVYGSSPPIRARCVCCRCRSACATA